MGRDVGEREGGGVAHLADGLGAHFAHLAHLILVECSPMIPHTDVRLLGDRIQGMPAASSELHPSLELVVRLARQESVEPVPAVVVLVVVGVVQRWRERHEGEQHARDHAARLGASRIPALIWHGDFFVAS